MQTTDKAGRETTQSGLVDYSLYVSRNAIVIDDDTISG